jgi:probable HAF family extracellular repeat protein
MYRKVLRVILLLIGFMAYNASADTIKYRFNGAISNFTTAPVPNVEIGTVFTGSFSYDSALPCSLCSLQTHFYVPGMLEITFTSPSNIVSNIVVNNARVRVDNDNANDLFSVDAGALVGIPFQFNGSEIQFLRIAFIDTTNTVFEDTTLPTTLNYADFNVHTLDLQQVSPFASSTGNVSSLDKAVPELTLYRLTDLGTLGGALSDGAAINDVGQVTGWALTSADEQHAFLWDGTAMQDLGTFGGPTSEGIAINASGQVTGQADLAGVFFAGQLVHHAFLWDGTALLDLGTLTTGTPSSGVAINSSGQVTGRSYGLYAGVALVQRAFLWDGTVMQDLGALGGGDSDGIAINDAGQATGNANTSGFVENHAFLWDGAVMLDLGTLGGPFSRGFAINAAGQVTGNSDTTVSGGQHAFLWDGTSLQDLGTLGGTTSSGLDINTSGMVTGWAATASESQHAFLWDGTAMLALEPGTDGQGNAINDAGQITGYAFAGGQHAIISRGTALLNLNALIDPADSLQPYVWLREGRDINLSGQIVANGIDSRTGQTHAYLVSPVVTQADTTPPTIQLNVAGVLGNNDWYVSDVQINWAVTDEESAISTQTGCDVAAVTADTSAVTLTCSATSAGGNSSESVTIKRDASAPVVQLFTPSNGTTYGRAEVVNADYDCNDEFSGIYTCIGPVANGGAIDTSTAGAKSFQVVAFDAAGNRTTVEHTYTVEAIAPFQFTAPAIGSVLQPGQPVSIEWTGGSPNWMVNLSLVDVSANTVAISIATTQNTGSYQWVFPSQNLPFAGPCGRTYKFYIEDSARTTPHYGPDLVVSCDLTPPVITLQVAGQQGSNGWYRGNVSLSWIVEDPESSIGSTSGCEAASVVEDTAGLIFTCTATSEGGTASESVTIKRDATRPFATAAVSPAPNANGWNRTNVTVSFSATDGLSGSGIATCTPDEVLKSELLYSGVLGFCTDVAGNDSNAAVAPNIRIDKTDPAASILQPAGNATYSRNQVVIARFSCSDTSSGVDTCVGTIANGLQIDTSKKAKNAKFTVDVIDLAGNKSKVEIKYTVN